MKEIPTLPETGFVRLKTVLHFIPVCPTAWWNGIRDGFYPKSVTLGKGVTAWAVEDIRALIEKVKSGQK